MRYAKTGFGHVHIDNNEMQRWLIRFGLNTRKSTPPTSSAVPSTAFGEEPAIEQLSGWASRNECKNLSFGGTPQRIGPLE